MDEEKRSQRSSSSKVGGRNPEGEVTPRPLIPWRGDPSFDHNLNNLAPFIVPVQEEAVPWDWTINVLVTGFGPFGNHSQNPSYLIARRLPTKHHIPGLPPIHIHTYPDPITVSYRAVRDLVPNLLFPDSPSPFNNNGDENNKKDKKSNPLPIPTPTKPNYDIILHIGMNSGSTVYTIETCAHRDGYTAADVLGENFAEDKFWKKFYNSPSTLFTSFPSDDLLARWKAKLANDKNNNLSPLLYKSTDAGNYICEFIFYTSLVEYWRRDPSPPPPPPPVRASTKDRPVMFLHVPGLVSEEGLERGKIVALGLVGALVESLVVGEKNGKS